MNSVESVLDRLKLAEQRAARYKRARDTAEALLEQKASELYESNQALAASHNNLQLDIKQATYELEASNERLIKALEEKTTFIGFVSHEVRTPLNAVIGLSELMLDMPMPPEQYDYAQTIFNSAKSLMKLINSVLDISKIESGKVNLSYTPVNVRNSIRSTLEMFQLEATRQNATLTLDIHNSVPKYLQMDEGRFVQILTNLVSNALKNAVDGEINISLEYRNGTLKCDVKDNGCGIPADKLNKIFLAYEQFGNLSQGVGLGLAICKHLCAAMKGSIDCVSELGKGSTFTFELPLDVANNPCTITVEEHDAEEFAALSVLIAEDNPVNQYVLNAQFAKLGITPKIVDNGQKALDEFESNKNYDVIFLDIQMPVLDGEQTLTAIRQSAVANRNTYCIALTANSYYNKESELLALGFNDFLSKPLEMDRLVAALDRANASQNTRSEGPAKTQSHDTDNTSTNSFDWTFLKSQFGSSAEAIFIQLAPVFLEHTFAELDQLGDAVASTDYTRIKKISHSIKGAALSLGLADTAAIFAGLESEPDSCAEGFPQAKAALLDDRQKIQTLLNDL